MAKFKLALITVTALLTFALMAPFSVDAQEARMITSDIADAADAVVHATVTTERAFEVDGTPYSIFELAVTNTISGNAAETVHVAVMGGMFADGRELIVSHTVQLEIGDELEAALVSADSIVGASVASALGAPVDSVYEVAGGEDGVLVLGGTLGAAEFAGANDYVLHGVSWESFDQAVPFQVNVTGSPLSQEQTIAVAKQAAKDWEKDSASSVDFVYDGTTSRSGPDLSDGVNSVSFQNVTTAGFLAQAHWIASRSGDILEFDIIVNTRYNFANGSGSGTWWDLASTLRHEFGHVLGLGHVGATTEVMTSSIFNNTVVLLGDGDRSGMRFLYPNLNPDSCNGELATVLLANGDTPTNGDDVILGTSGNDTIDGLGGNDTICGLGGNDTIRGGDGDDTIYGGLGADNLSGNDGRDTLFGEGGADTITGGELGDEIWGGDGSDTLSGDGGWDWIYGENGDDVINGGLGSDKIFGGAGNDQIFGNNGPDKIEGNEGSDYIEAGKGRDQVLGGAGDDEIHGNSGPDTLSGDDGLDTLNGNRGADVLFGGANDDQLFGGGGWDTLVGGSEFDLCNGGFGQDTARKCEIIISTP